MLCAGAALSLGFIRVQSLPQLFHMGQQALSPPSVLATLHFTVRVWSKLRRSHTRPVVANRVLETQLRSIRTNTVVGQGNWGLPIIQMSERWTDTTGLSAS